MTTTIRIVKEGILAKVYLPDGSEITGVLSAEVSLGCSGADRDIGKLTLVLSDFVVESRISKRATETAEARVAP